MPPIGTGANRRSGQRRAPRSNVRVEVRRGLYGLGKNLAVLFLDVSESGVRVVVKEELKEGDATEVLLQGFGIRKPMKTTATVCWAMTLDNGMFCIGLSFDKRLPYRDICALFKP